VAGYTAPMNAGSALTLAIALALLLAACGNKGSLVLPSPAYDRAPPADALPVMDDATEAGEPEQILPPDAEDPPADPPPADDGNG
jgi:predicted small lipoprotein YifL